MKTGLDFYWRMPAIYSLLCVLTVLSVCPAMYTFMECESYCSYFGGMVACVYDAAQEEELGGIAVMAVGFPHVWVGYNDHDNHGSWR